MALQWDDAELSTSTMTAAAREHTEDVVVESDPDAFGAAISRADKPEEKGTDRADRVMTQTGRGDDCQECQPEESHGPQPPAGLPFLR
jgi:hypothetical protein